MERRTALIIAVVLAGGCEKPPVDNAPAPRSTPAAPSPPGQTTGRSPAVATRPEREEWRPSEDSRVARFVGLEAPKPVTWIEHPPQGSMRAANYTVPGRGGSEAAHIVVFYMGPDQGGDLELNIERWQGQFRPDEENNLIEPLVETIEVNGMRVTLVELAGDYRKSGTTWYTPDQLLITAVVEAPRGAVFIRFVGQTATVEANRQEFMKMVEGLRAISD